MALNLFYTNVYFDVCAPPTRPLAARETATLGAVGRISGRWEADLGHSSRKENHVRKFAILLIVLSPLVLAGCGSGVTVEGESPVEIPEQIEAGGVTVQAPEEVKVGDVTLDTEDGRITAQ